MITFNCLLPNGLFKFWPTKKGASVMRIVRNFAWVAFFVAFFFAGYSHGEEAKEDIGTFACAVNCMDGRVQEVVRDHMKATYKVDWVDMITEPGPDKILCECVEKAVLQDVQRRLKISVEHHGSRVVAIVGHEGCAGNPVAKEEHIKHLKEDKKTVQTFGLPVKITLLWVPKGWKRVEVIE